MTAAERLRGEIAIELEHCRAIRQTILETLALAESRPLTTLEMAGASSLLMQCYNSFENIFKRILRYYNLPMPTGDTSHFQLLTLFATQHDVLPFLVTDDIRLRMSQLRKVRHVNIHGYSHALEPEMIFVALRECPPVFERFSENIGQFLGNV